MGVIAVLKIRAGAVHFKGGAVDIVFSGDDRESFDSERRGLAESGRIKIIRGLGRTAYLFSEDPSIPGGALAVFHSSKNPNGPGSASFAIRPVAFTAVPIRGLMTMARAVLQYPKL
jgi:hypothetical protein